MESRIFEDMEMSDLQRQATGMSQGVYDSLDTVQNAYAKTQPPTTDLGNKPYPLGTVDKILSDAFISLMNIDKLLDQAKGNPNLDKKVDKLSTIQKRIKKINKEIVDVSQSLDII